MCLKPKTRGDVKRARRGGTSNGSVRKNKQRKHRRGESDVVGRCDVGPDGNARWSGRTRGISNAASQTNISVYEERKEENMRSSAILL